MRFSCGSGVAGTWCRPKAKLLVAAGCMPCHAMEYTTAITYSWNSRLTCGARGKVCQVVPGGVPAWRARDKLSEPYNWSHNSIVWPAAATSQIFSPIHHQFSSNSTTPTDYNNYNL